MISLRTLTNRPSKIFVSLLAVGAMTAGVQQARATDTSWSNTGTDFNTPANWSNGTPSGRRDLFDTNEVMQPNLSASLSAIGLFFSGNNYDLTAAAGATLTLTAYGTGGASGATNSTAAAIYSSATGTNTIDASIALVPPTGHTVSTLYQSGNGTLILNGAISGTGITVSINGGGNASPGTIQLNGANTFDSGVTINGTAETLVIGNDSALGTGTFTPSATSTIQAGGGARTIANSIALNGNTTISGSNAFTFNGDMTSNTASRVLTDSNTGGAAFGNVFLATDDMTARGLTISGSSAVAINGVVANNNFGNTVASALSYSGSGTLTLNNANTYSGKTTISGGNVIANHDGAFGLSNVSLAAGTISLTLQNGVTQQYIGNNASLSIIAGQVINLNFSGTNVIGSLIIDGTPADPGVYGANFANPNGDFLGLGTLTVIPEPSVYMLLGVGLLLCGQRFFRRRRAS